MLMTTSGQPKTDARKQRFEAWLRHASTLDLQRTYESARRSRNTYQKRAVIDEMRRRELEETSRI